MRKILIISIIFGLITVLFIVIQKGFQTSVKHTEKKEVSDKKKSKKIPLFEFSTINGEVFSKYNLEKNKATIIIYFDPDCGLCEKTGTIFSKFKSIHKNSNVLFVSSNSKEKIEKYREKFELDQLSNIVFLRSNEDDFYNAFKESHTPSYFIYNTKQKLVKIINDDVPVKIILRYIKASQIES